MAAENIVHVIDDDSAVRESLAFLGHPKQHCIGSVTKNIFATAIEILRIEPWDITGK